jgi:phage terminase large subunit
LKSNPNFIHLKRTVPKDRITLLQGGTRSGKTWAVIYYLIWMCDNYTGLEIDICRDTFTALKATVWKDFKFILHELGEYNVKNHNRTDHIYYLNGNTINYYGADNPEKIHGRSRDILWINEAHQFDDETVDQLFPRTKHRIIADYNPALAEDHWLDRYIPKYPPLVTTYKDNPHLTNSQVIDIESRIPTINSKGEKIGNMYWWAVYGTGIRTKPVGAIFQNWTIGEFDDSLPYIYGQDYGFSNDPTTLVKVAIDEGQRIIYCEELLYEKGLGTHQIAEILKKQCGDSLIIGDSAEPRLISELQAEHINIEGAQKGQGSVTGGIGKMLDYKIVITPSSENLRKEFNNYIWADKKTSVPVDKWNHIVDAVRYAFTRLSGDKGNYAWGVQ